MREKGPKWSLSGLAGTHQGQLIPTQTQFQALEPKVRSKTASFRGGGQDPRGLVGVREEDPSISWNPKGPPCQSWTEGYSDPLTVAVWSPLPPLLGIHRPKPWISSCLGQKEWVWRREAIPGQIPLPPQGEFQEPPWLDSWVPPHPLLPALPPLGTRGQGGFRAEGAGRVFHNLSLPRLWAGLTSSPSLAPGARAASFPGAGTARNSPPQTP